MLLAGCSGTTDSPSSVDSASQLSVADTHVHAIERAGPGGQIPLAMSTSRTPAGDIELLIAEDADFRAVTIP